MDTQTYILDKYKLDLKMKAPIEIPNVDRTSLAKLFCELDFKIGVEVGTEEGNYAKVLCESNPSLHLYCVDPFEIYPDYRDYNNKTEKLFNSENKAKNLLKSYNVTFIKKYSMDAINEFEDNSLDFVYIDANHEFPFVVEDIYYWNRKVKPGGIVSGHDYYRTKSKNSRCHVVAAIHGYTSAYFIHPWFVLGSKAMNPGELRDHSRSWMFVKEWVHESLSGKLSQVKSYL
jgi:hypothetical protein